MTIYWEWNLHYMTFGFHYYRGRYYSKNELFQSTYTFEIGFGPLILNILKVVEHDV